MNLFIKSATKALLPLLAVVVMISACKKDDPNKNLDPPRLFKPSAISVKTDQTSAKITWTAPILSTGQKLTYTAQFSQDTTFASTEFTMTSDTSGLTVTDDKLAIRKKYYVRIKANAYQDQPESKWVESSGFSITGEQLFYPIRDVEVKETAVTLRFKSTTGLTAIALTPKNGTATNYTISASELTAGIKVISGLTAGTDYQAELFLGTKSKGLLTFTTQAATVYTQILNPGDNLVTIISNAPNNAVIGLKPGTYSAGASNFTILQKTITLKSTSGNPADTKVTFKEFTLRGTGAGLNVSGIEFDGSASTASYFINLTGVSADAEQATFTQVTVDNCIVHDANTSFMRANRGAAAGDYKMDQIVVKNTLVYNIGSLLSYNCFHLDKLQFNTLNVTKSTFYNIGQALLTCATTISGTPPNITFDYCTFNNFGAQSKYVLMDANANPVKFSLTNSIIGNVPRPSGAVQAVVIRASGAGTSMVFSNNDTFNFTNGSNAALTFPTTNITQSGNQAIDLGWTATTTDFTLPANSPLRTASNVSTAIGDPRWSY